MIHRAPTARIDISGKIKFQWGSIDFRFGCVTRFVLRDRNGGASGCGYTILIGACAVLYHWTIASIYYCSAEDIWMVCWILVAAAELADMRAQYIPPQMH